MTKVSNKPHEIAFGMYKNGLPTDFIKKVGQLAGEYEGMYDLMKMWIETESEVEALLICKDLEELIKDCFFKQNCKLL